MADPLGVLFSNFGLPSHFMTGKVSNTYTVAGTLVSGDRLSVLNSASAIAITVPAGYKDGQTAIIKNMGAGTATLTLNIDGVASTSTSLTTKSVLRLAWSAALATWLSL